jgi:hypothetical protein
MFTGGYKSVKKSGELTEPSLGQTVTSSFESSFFEPLELTIDKPGKFREQLDVLKKEASIGDQSLSQKTLNGISSLAGSILNPYSIIAGEGLGGLARAGVAKAAPYVGKYLPSEVKSFVNKPLHEIIEANAPNYFSKHSINEVGKGAANVFAQGTGFTLPEKIAETYDPKTDKFNYFGGVKSSFADGGLALMLTSVPYTAGVIWSKISKAKISEAISPKVSEVASHAEMPLPGEGVHLHSVIDQALEEKRITPDEAQWAKDYFAKSVDNKELTERATKLLADNGHDVDSANNKVILKLFNKDDAEQVQSVLGDQLAATHIPEDVRKSMLDFVAGNKVDNWRSMPKEVIDGVKGVVSFLKKRLEKAPEERIDIHGLVRRYFPESKKQSNPFTQKKLYEAITKEGRTGLTVPSHIKDKLSHEAKLKKINQKISGYKKELENTGKSKYKKLIERNEKELERLGSSKELLSYKDEIEHIKSKLLPEGKVAQNFKTMNEYHRLHDLTRVKTSARALMHEVHLAHEHELHKSYATLLDTITKVVDSGMGRIGKTNNVIDYMNERIKNKVPELENIEAKDVKEDVKITREKINKGFEEVKSPDGRKEAIERFDRDMEETAADHIKEEFEQLKNQYKEFVDKTNIFKTAVQCAIGALNG